MASIKSFNLKLYANIFHACYEKLFVSKLLHISLSGCTETYELFGIISHMMYCWHFVILN